MEAEELDELYRQHLLAAIRPPIAGHVVGWQARAQLGWMEDAAGRALSPDKAASTWIWSDLHLDHASDNRARETPAPGRGDDVQNAVPRLAGPSLSGRHDRMPGRRRHRTTQDDDDRPIDDGARLQDPGGGKPRLPAGARVAKALRLQRDRTDPGLRGETDAAAHARTAGERSKRMLERPRTHPRAGTGTFIAARQRMRGTNELRAGTPARPDKRNPPTGASNAKLTTTEYASRSPPHARGIDQLRTLTLWRSPEAPRPHGDPPFTGSGRQVQGRIPPRARGYTRKERSARTLRPRCPARTGIHRLFL